MSAVEVQQRHVKHAVLDTLGLAQCCQNMNYLINAFAHIAKLYGKLIACMTLLSPPQHGAHCGSQVPCQQPHCVPA